MLLSNVKRADLRIRTEKIESRWTTSSFSTEVRLSALWSERFNFVINGLDTMQGAAKIFKLAWKKFSTSAFVLRIGSRRGGLLFGEDAPFSISWEPGRGASFNGANVCAELIAHKRLGRLRLRFGLVSRYGSKTATISDGLRYSVVPLHLKRQAASRESSPVGRLWLNMAPRPPCLSVSFKNSGSRPRPH